MHIKLGNTDFTQEDEFVYLGVVTEMLRGESVLLLE